MKDCIVVDVETGPSENASEFFGEFEAPSNYTDPKKIAAYIENAKAKAIEKAALSAITGRILVIGVLHPFQDEPMYFEGNEKDLLTAFWTHYRERGKGDQVAALPWVGFNIKQFDMPFLTRRSWVHGVKVPPVFTDRGYLLPHFIDVRETWCCGDRQAEGSLDVIARLMGLPGKPGGMTGADFARVYAEDKPKALAYLKYDLTTTRTLAEKLL